jgi:hypothetical protein
MFGFSPRYDWMKEKFGRKIQSVRPIMEYARESLKTPDSLKMVDEAMEKMKRYFQKEFIENPVRDNFLKTILTMRQDLSAKRNDLDFARNSFELCPTNTAR